LLPDHLHCRTLPEDDADYSTRWGLIKSWVTNHMTHDTNVFVPSSSRKKRREQSVWQRRLWEHRIRDDGDFQRHCDYIRYNPVKHGLCSAPKQWPFSSFQRFVKEGSYELAWGSPLVHTSISGIEEGFGE